MQSTLYLNLLRNHIDIERVPFSDRGSRLLIYQHPDSDRLFIKLAERLTALEPHIEAYLNRPPFIHGLAFLDQDGQPLDFSVASTPQALFFGTRAGDFGLVFQDRRTISIGLPAETITGVQFIVSPEYWQSTTAGGSFKYVRNISYQSNAEVVENEICPREDGYQVTFRIQSGVDSAITLHISPELDLTHEVFPFSTAQGNAQRRWQEWFDRVPPCPERYARTYAYAWWIMANNLISPMGKVMYEAMMPSKVKYVGLWLWDNAMHALAYRHVDSDIARNQIRSMLAHQLPNGMLPDAIYDEGIVAQIDHPILAEVTKPPILAWAALKLHETEPDVEFLREIYLSLVRLNSWWLTMNDDDVDGLMQYNHPYSSGLDDSPLWDYGMPVESPDINTYIAIQMSCLAEIAEIIDVPSEAATFRRRSAALVNRMLQDFWDEEAGLFWAYQGKERIPVVTPFNLYPLWTGHLAQPHIDRLLAHLTNPDEFWGAYPLPTVARNDPHYDPETMWRGPVWANINYFFVEALQKNGLTRLAAELREKTLDMINAHRDIFEYYNPESGDPPAAAANIFGWSAAVFIDLAIQMARDEQGDNPSREL